MLPFVNLLKPLWHEGLSGICILGVAESRDEWVQPQASVSPPAPQTWANPERVLPCSADIAVSVRSGWLAILAVLTRSIAPEQTGVGSRLEAYPTGDRRDLSLREIAITEAERQVTAGFSDIPTGLELGGQGGKSYRHSATPYFATQARLSTPTD